MAVLLARTKLLPAGATLALKKKAGRVLKLLNQRSAELSIALVSNREIQALNAAYRRQNKPTDVLSFPAEERLPTGGRLLGDVILSVEQARKQARARRRPLEQELELLLIHGILHLLGYDHERSPADEEIMRSMERGLRRALSQERS
jgi:rRNA maturation RNase YbeY